MRAPRIANAAEIRVTLLDQSGIGQIGALHSPVVELLRTVVRRDELIRTHGRQPVWLVEGQGTENQCVDYAEAACGGTDADRERGDGEEGVAWPASPKTQCVFAVLGKFSQDLCSHSEYTIRHIDRFGKRLTPGATRT